MQRAQYLPHRASTFCDPPKGILSVGLSSHGPGASQAEDHPTRVGRHERDIVHYLCCGSRSRLSNSRPREGRSSRTHHERIGHLVRHCATSDLLHSCATPVQLGQRHRAPSTPTRPLPVDPNPMTLLFNQATVIHGAHPRSCSSNVDVVCPGQESARQRRQQRPGRRGRVPLSLSLVGCTIREQQRGPSRLGILP